MTPKRGDGAVAPSTLSTMSPAVGPQIPGGSDGEMAPSLLNNHLILWEAIMISLVCCPYVCVTGTVRRVGDKIPALSIANEWMRGLPFGDPGR